MINPKQGCTLIPSCWGFSKNHSRQFNGYFKNSKYLDLVLFSCWKITGSKSLLILVTPRVQRETLFGNIISCYHTKPLVSPCV